MGFSISRWLRPESNACLLCERSYGMTPQQRGMPLRHPEARRILQELCVSCYGSIPWLKAPVCRICGRPEICPDCPRRQERHFVFCRSAVRYDNRMKDLLALYKYRGSQRLEPVMAAVLACAYERVSSELRIADKQPLFDFVTSVPLAQQRLEDRGFNQAEAMAQLLAEWYGLTYLPLLQRVRHTEKQSLKNRRSRLADMKGNFSATKRFSSLVDRAKQKPMRILLIDDIYTTGSTVNECARAMREAMTLSPSAANLEIYGALWSRS